MQLLILIDLFSKVDMWYLHGPDRTIPYEITLKAVNELYNEGYFKAFGISNYMSSVNFALTVDVNPDPFPPVGKWHRLRRSANPMAISSLQFTKAFTMRFKGLRPPSISFSTVLIILARRTVEPELFPCLRKYGISFYAFSPRTHVPSGGIQVAETSF